MLASLPSERTFDVDAFLAREYTKDLLRFTTAGSVDDGKSTLIGRLLYDSHNVYEDQIRAVAKSTVNRSAGDLDLSLLTDGLRAEREQGITIDVAYRYFATARRKFIIADTPGHEQYTRNMATGASTADLAIILIDARHGVQPQSRRHAYIAALLGIPRFVVAINKMDLVGFSESTFDTIRSEFASNLEKLGVRQAYFLPISALTGDNVVNRATAMPWFDGPSLLEHLETVDIQVADDTAPFRMPVQRVIRPDQSFRGYAGQVAGGSIRPGDELMVLPSGRRTRLKSIDTFDGTLTRAFAPMSVTLTLEDELDISRGDLLSTVAEIPNVARNFEASIVWLHEQPLDPARTYALKHTTQSVTARVTALHERINMQTLESEPAGTLTVNGIGVVDIETSQAIYFDTYQQNRITGAAILIDPATKATVGALMIRRAIEQQGREQHPVTAKERTERYGHAAAGIALTGREGLARRLERLLFDRGALPVVAGEYNEAFIALGALVLVTGGSHAALKHPPALPLDDAEAAPIVIRWLEQERILRPAGTEWREGEGI